MYKLALTYYGKVANEEYRITSNAVASRAEISVETAFLSELGAKKLHKANEINWVGSPRDFDTREITKTEPRFLLAEIHNDILSEEHHFTSTTKSFELLAFRSHMIGIFKSGLVEDLSSAPSGKFGILPHIIDCSHRRRPQDVQN